MYKNMRIKNKQSQLDLGFLKNLVEETIESLNLVCASIEQDEFVAELIVASTGRLMTAKIVLLQEIEKESY